ncbi:MAG TPA: hypothetical protein VM582_02800 [Candidatus Thermoplasmatota archaeon]|nr:hypothetical protein [Candidatus Thermoplasmatota archaeon]
MRTLLLALATLGLVAGLARADHTCEEDEATATLETPAGTFYLVADDCSIHHGCLFSVWIYMESNGHPGLQRGCDPYGYCNGCPADTIVF